MLLNNMAENFNAWIMDARDKFIITMLEMICRQLQARFHKKKVGAKATLQQTPNALCPKIFIKLEKAKSDSTVYMSQWQNGLEFEVKQLDAPLVVSGNYLGFDVSTLVPQFIETSKCPRNM